MTVAVCLAVGLKTSDLRVRDIVEKVQRKSRRVCLGGRVGVGSGRGRGRNGPQARFLL